MGLSRIDQTLISISNKFTAADDGNVAQQPPPAPPPMQPPLDSSKLPQSFIDDGVEKPALMDKEAAAQYAAETTYCRRDAFIFLPAAKTPRFSFYMCSLSQDVNHCFTVSTQRPSFAAAACCLHDIWAIVKAQGAICSALRLIPSVCQTVALTWWAEWCSLCCTNGVLRYFSPRRYDEKISHFFFHDGT